MCFTLSQSSVVHLLDITDSYQSGMVSKDELVKQVGCGIRQLETILQTSNDFLLALDAAQHYFPADGRPIFTSAFADAHSYRITLLGIPENVCIPLHDHPQMVSIVVFLSGKIHSPIYDVISMDRGNLVKLRQCEDRTYSQGDIVVLMPEVANLHSMKALTTKAVCLSIQLSTTSGLSKQTCFFPAVPKDAESEFTLWFRKPFRSS